MKRFGWVLWPGSGSQAFSWRGSRARPERLDRQLVDDE